MLEWQKIPNVDDRLKWYQNGGKLKLNFFLSVIFVGMILNGYDGSIIAGLQALDPWHEDLGFPTATQIGLLNACGSFSGILAGPLIAFIDERFGRRWGIRFYGYTILIGSVIGCIAGIDGVNGYAMFITGRVIIGFGLAAFLMTSMITVQEISHPRSRTFVAQSWNSYYIIGLTLASFIILGCSYLSGSWSWRIPYILQVPLALYVLIGVQFIPESPRWLQSKGREEEAFQFLVTYHGNGDPNDELVLFEYEEMKETLAAEMEAKAEKWGTIIRTPGSRHRLGLAALMTFLTNLSGSSIIYWYYTVVFDQVGITGASTQTGIAAGLNVFTWFCQIGATFASKRIGRRTIILCVWPVLLLSLGGLCATAGVYANSDSTNKSAGIATVALVWVYLGTFNLSNPVLYSYPAEVQTYAMRTKGLLVWNTLSQCMGAYVTWVDAIALDKIGYKYYGVYMPLVAIQWVLAYKYMLEVKGLTLEEIHMVFDGPEALVPILNRASDQEHGDAYRAAEYDSKVSDEGK
ncbi:hypothetical protein QFC22_006179 [Naganishia vaughanmartiniae]|uniref:Uncharacterized protein n=1 Tax=Naganishia vaughanmartiniae TaxID=1424756 RepID=A0ACC2WNP5_9TREE|nr:hypothetical protein QFC22_006179 [Naganishia vaughanmartiniae]